MAEVLGRLPRSANPDLLVGFETSDDAGVFLVPSGASPLFGGAGSHPGEKEGHRRTALVQTMDFFTPIVDDPYSYGQIAAANALSDVYAMGGRPITVMNIACFDPTAAPPEVWAQVLLGMHDKTVEAGAVVVGGHTIDDPMPKFGMSVTGLVDPDKILRNDLAEPGDGIWLSKPLGTGIATTAAKNDRCRPDELAAAIESMSTLNAAAAEAALAAGARCATDVTGFGLAGHLFNIARSSGVAIEIECAKLPVLPGIERMVAEGCVTGGATRTREFLADRLRISDGVPSWLVQLALDPQTSGGLAVASARPVEGSVLIGRVLPGGPEIALI
ncbi:MAG: selenide, water dikinase SelD [Fimbriimonadaceae bacterium]|nr:selenide, water dikinase SelD [Fimbriimonadaceae bacterium]QYK56728.1 MAG: selenide, water dikinase SelD [Fimbriimonadaceae bacterium]